MADQQLAGVGVLVTRPSHQAVELVDAIEDHGGTAVRFPVIDIVPRGAAEIAADEALLKDPDIVIFVSRNAVQFGLAHTADAIVAAVGPATTAALEAAGHRADIRPELGFDSEHLLAEPHLLDVADKTVRIVRGTDGRELLADTLRSRGAFVDYLPVYERRLPQYTDAELGALEARWRSGDIDLVTVMSVESVRNLGALLPDWCKNQLRNTSLVTPAARVLKEALARFPGTSATLAAGPLAGDMVRAIIELWHTAPGRS